MMRPSVSKLPYLRCKARRNADSAEHYNTPPYHCFFQDNIPCDGIRPGPTPARSTGGNGNRGKRDS